MKKILLLSTLFFMCFAIFAQDEHAPLDRGFYVNLGVSVPSSSYLTPKSSLLLDGDFSYEFKPGLHFEIGNKFYFGAPIADVLRIGLDVSWIGIQSNSSSIFDTKFQVVNIQPIKLGPLVSYALNDNMAIDVKYSLVPTIGIAFDEDDAETLAGALSELALAYRFKILSVGLAYQFGTVKFTEDLAEGEDLGLDYSLKMNAFRVLVGIKL